MTEITIERETETERSSRFSHGPAWRCYCGTRWLGLIDTRSDGSRYFYTDVWLSAADMRGVAAMMDALDLSRQVEEAAP